MGFHAQHFFHLQVDVGVDEIVVHHAAGLEEVAVGIEALERLAERAADGRDVLQLFRRQRVEVLVHGRTRIDLLVDAVEAGHHQGCEGQVRVRRRIREADFDALALRRRGPRNTDRGRTVAGRVGQQHGRFIARHQTLVGVGRRVRERVDCLGMLDDAADVPQAFLREVGVLVAGEQRVAVFPDRLVHMHARAVVLVVRLRHEGGGLAVRVRDVVHDVFVELHVVGHLDQRVETHAQLVLRRGDLVVVLLRLEAHLGHQRQHFRAHVLERVDRRDGEVATLRARTVTHVAAFIGAAGVVGQFRIVELIASVVRVGIPLHIREHEELGFRTEIGGVADARRLQVHLGLLRHRTRVAVVRRVVVRVENVAHDGERRVLEERVDTRGRWIRHQKHVGLVDGLPARDRRAVEHRAVLEERLVDHREIKCDVLHLAAHVGEAQVDVLDVLFLDGLEDCVRHLSLRFTPAPSEAVQLNL